MIASKGLIWVIDDHQLFGAGMQQMLINATQHYDVQCFSAPQAAKKESPVEDLRLIIMDYYIPDADPLVWIEHFVENYPDTPIIVISSSISPSDKLNSLQVGASAYYPKHTSPPLIMAKICQWLEKGKANKECDTTLAESEHNLTPRQIDILIQLARGGSNKRIAKVLKISPETVKTHITAIYKIIDCDTRDQAIEWARLKGFV